VGDERVPTRGHAGDDPAAVVERIDALAARTWTPCGAGAMVWRAWGRGRPLVLLHGASGSWTHFIRNILPLAARHRVLAPDMPGFGDSATPPEPHTAGALADIVAAGLDAVVPPPAEIDMAGFSFGGIVGGLVAARLGRRVGTLVLIGAGGLGRPAAPTPPLRRLEPGMTAEQIADTHRANLGILMLADPARADDVAVFVQAENLRRARFKSGAIPASDTLLRALPAIRARLAGIWASHDAFVGPDLATRRRLLLTVRPDIDFRVIEGAGHWVPYEAAAEVNAALLDILGA
jgi:pimeloyl-ACP methyl ester carboxylesterase